MKKIDFKNYQIKKSAEPESKITQWQAYGIQVCKDFNITGNYKLMIFKQAKRNIEYLRGRVENAKEKFGTAKLEDKGNYLVSLFRKKKPWDT
jgi:hypothetical protein